MNKSTEIACRLDALSSAEQARRAALFSQLQEAIRDVRELADGYQVSLDPSAMQRNHVEELTRLEARCCAFLSFSLTADSESLSLRITGGSDAKRFLAREFGLAAQDPG